MPLLSPSSPIFFVMPLLRWVHMVCEDAIAVSREYYSTKTLLILRNDPSPLKLGRFDHVIAEVMAKLHTVRQS